jgi:hypothetical protein
MSFLPAAKVHLRVAATPATAFSGFACIAVNRRGTLLAYVHPNECLTIHQMEEGLVPTGKSFVYEPLGGFCSPTFVCFVLRNGVDTVMIADEWHGIVEVTAEGTLLRCIYLRCRGVAYSEKDDALAVIELQGKGVTLLHYVSGLVKLRLRCYTRVRNPVGVSFTADGAGVVVADASIRTISKFSTSSGEFIGHVLTFPDAATIPRGVVALGDGGIVVAIQDDEFLGSTGALLFYGSDNNLRSCHEGILPCSPVSFHGGVIACDSKDGRVWLFAKAWFMTSRKAWIAALTIT